MLSIGLLRSEEVIYYQRVNLISEKNMEDTVEAILERIEFSKKEVFEKFLYKIMHISNDSTRSTYAVHDNVCFKLDAFYKGFPSFCNEFGKDKKYVAAVHALSIILEELGVEAEKEECFILYHLRDLGKFRIREDKLFDELKKTWGGYPEYKMEKNDLTYALKNMMRTGFINYRRGNLTLNPSLIIRYRTR